MRLSLLILGFASAIGGAWTLAQASSHYGRTIAGIVGVVVGVVLVVLAML